MVNTKLVAVLAAVIGLTAVSSSALAHAEYIKLINAVTAGISLTPQKSASRKLHTSTTLRPILVGSWRTRTKTCPV